MASIEANGANNRNGGESRLTASIKTCYRSIAIPSGPHLQQNWEPWNHEASNATATSARSVAACQP
eukprot:319938-Rhodomonas_salina.1